MIDAGVNEAEARRRFFLIDRNGLLVEGMAGITPAQMPFLQGPDMLAGWPLTTPNKIGLLDVVSNAWPTALIGVSGQAGAFTEPVIRAMAKAIERPIIFPLSNPTSRSEATPEQLMAWSDGRALIGTGSPFPPVAWKGVSMKVTQTNNSYIFPGIGLGVLAAGARRITDAMFMQAAKAVALMSPAAEAGEGQLLPPVTQLRAVAVAVAKAVARQAQADHVADPCDAAELDRRIAAYVWEARYRPYQKID
jgi:malate dehydrogenase (oxaloacetate-decarboxylating)